MGGVRVDRFREPFRVQAEVLDPFDLFG